MLIRQGDVFEGLLDIERVMPEDMVKASIDAYASKGAILCHTNKTRNLLNKEMRARMGHTGPLVEGEPLLVVKNNYTVELYNGEIVAFEGWEQAPSERSFRDKFNDVRLSVRVGRATISQGQISPLLCVDEVMGELDPKFQSSVAYYCGKVNDRQEMLHANLGYVLTCHKAQGSEFPNVLVCAEPTVRPNTLDGRRWLYTAITRSKESVKLCFTGA
jgi:exodeoxyribonuclease-5